MITSLYMLALPSRHSKKEAIFLLLRFKLAKIINALITPWQTLTLTPL
jgi:hypothetical protein